MNRILLNCIALSAALLSPATSFGQVACTRNGLQAATDLYLEAQGKGDPAGMPLAQGLAYIENMQAVDIKSGVIQKPLKIDFHRTLIDQSTCQTFTETIVTDKSHPYVIGTRLRVNHDKIAEIESLVTQEGDWLFNADNYFKWVPGEDWGAIPAAQRDTRATQQQPRRTPTLMLSSSRSSTQYRGGIRATGRKAVSTLAKVSRKTAARSAYRAVSISSRDASSSTKRWERWLLFALSESADYRIPTSFGWRRASCVSCIR